MSGAPATGKALILASGGGIGDVLFATPVMRALRMKATHVTALVQPHHVDIVAPAAADEVWSDFGTTLALAERIRAGKFEYAVVTWATARVAYAVRLANVPIRVGPARRIYSALFTHRVRVPSEFGDRTTHWSQIQLNYARAIGCDGAPEPIVPRDATGDAQAQAIAREYGLTPGSYAMLHPSRGITATRPSWPTSTFAELSRALTTAFGLPILISGSSAERAGVTGIAQRARSISIAGRIGIRGYAALAENARFVVAMDSGPMHIAAATGVPTVGIFAMRPDEPDRWRPLGAKTTIIRPAYACPVTHTKENCPDFACVRSLDCAAVVTAAAGLLEHPGESKST